VNPRRVVPDARVRWSGASLAVVGGACLVALVVHIALIDRYGYHGDELYFLDCGRHLAFGYVDHAPLVPWLARLGEELGGGLFGLRLPAVLAGVGTLVLVALLVHEWGGGWRAQLLALLALLIAPAHLRMRAMLDIPVVEVMLCTATSYLVARALARHERWTWVLAGGALGLAMLAKHSSLLWGGALAMGLIATHGPQVFHFRWPWLGISLALLMFLPNLVWQVRNGFPTLDFLGTLRAEVLESQGRPLFAAGQLLYFHPFAVPIWGAGVASAWLARRESMPWALLFLLLFGFYLVVGGKPYYLASAYPPVLAAGGVALERWFERHVALRRTFVAVLAATGLAFATLTLPLLPLQRIDSTLGSVLGWVVPPMALTHDLHGMFGWPEHAATVDAVYRALPEADRRSASVLTGSYAQAGAINQFRDPDTPRAVSGHMTYHVWGPDPLRGGVLIAYGMPLELLERHYRSCRVEARIDVPLARPGDTDLPVYVCRRPLAAMESWWPELRRYRHRPSSSAFAPARRARLTSVRPPFHP